MRPLPSGSAVGRVVSCPPSHLLPHVDRRDVYGARGDGVHGFLLQVDELRRRGVALAEARDTALAEVPPDAPHFTLCEVVDLESLPAGGYSELALAWNVETDAGRVLGHNIGREYLAHGWDPRHEFPATADRLGLMEVAAERVLYIPDWKSGVRTCSAADSWQGRLLALAGARAFEATRVRFAHAYLRDDGSTRWDTVEYDELDLLGIADDLRRLRKRLHALDDEMERGEPIDVAEGTHCGYCPAFNACPAKNRLARSMLAIATDLGESLASLSDEEAGRAVIMVREIMRVATRVAEALKDRARNASFMLPTGKLYGEVPGNDEVDAEIAAAVLRLNYGEDVERAAITRTTSKTAIDQAVRAWARARGEKLGKAVDEAFDRIRLGGGITRGPARIGEVRP